MGKEDFILPPGVHKGADYFGKEGAGIEVGGERSAARIRSRLPEDRSDLLIIDESKSYFLDLPSLADMPYSAPIWVPRFNPDTGAIYTSRWDTPKLEKTDLGTGVANGERYRIIRKSGYKKIIDLNNLPKTWTVARLIPQEIWDGVESALRQQDEIRVDYGSAPGAEQEVVEELLVGIRSLSEVFKEAQITRDALQEISEKTQKFLENMGLTSPTDDVKQNLARALITSAQTDSVKRLNPMISRIKLRSAYLSTVKREVVGRLIREKSNRVFEVLLMEREVTRDQLEMGDEAIKWLLNEHSVFVNPDHFTTPRDFTDREVSSTVNSIRGLIGGLNQVRVAPYLAPARIVETLLTDVNYKPKRDQLSLERSLEVVNMQWLLKQHSAEEYIRMRHPREAIDRLVQAQTVIKESLSDPDNSVYTTFSSQ